MRPRLLDLFCGAGGAAMGYYRAGFDVVGVDVKRQPRYPFPFVQADALDFPLDGFDVVHASPPCQAHSAVTPTKYRAAHPDLIPPTRERLREWGGLYVIENVAARVLRDPVMLCGGAVGLPLKRHRFFESNLVLPSAGCMCGVQRGDFGHYHGKRGHYRTRVVTVAGSTGGRGGVELWRVAMGVPWMTGAELAQAIPPAYTETIGPQLIAALPPTPKPPRNRGKAVAVDGPAALGERDDA